MIERIPYKVAALNLGYKSYRGFRNWCNKNGVALLADKGSRKLYVIKVEFLSAANNSSVNHILNKISSVQKVAK